MRSHFLQFCSSMSPKKLRRLGIPPVRLSAISAALDSVHSSASGSSNVFRAPSSLPATRSASSLDVTHTPSLTNSTATASRAIGSRADAPLVLPNTRGDKKVAIEAASSTKSRAIARNNLERDMTSTGGA